MTLFCSVLLKLLGQQDKALSIVFLNAGKIRSLNHRYRNRDYATDVLSFSYGQEELDGVPFLGELFIAPEIAAKNAVRYGIFPDKELRKLLVHGVLHLMGHDHEKDTGLMNRMQGKLLRRKFFVNSPPLLQLKVNQ